MSPALPQTESWVLVDADSGRVLGGFNHHQAKPPASTTKLMTALVAMEKLPNHSTITIGPGAAAQPAMRIGMTAGQVWKLDDALKSLMLVSANDAAYALAEAASGSLQGFADDMNAAAKRYGMKDSVFNDPAGFDDSASFNGGSSVSAYDLAIAARNYLSIPDLAAASTLTEYRFTGPQRDHVLHNHNKLLRRYPGAIGLKTGFTRRAGHTFVGAAKRDGRTMIAVVMRSDNIYGASSALLDAGFASPRGAAGTGEVLPAPAVRLYQPPSVFDTVAARGAKVVETKTVATKTVAVQRTSGRPETGSTGGDGGWLQQLMFVLGGSALGVFLLRRRAVRRQRARAARRREARRVDPQRVDLTEDWGVLDVSAPLEEAVARAFYDTSAP